MEQKELPISELELVYLNGQEHGGAPVFKDVRLTRDSQTICDQILELAKNHDKRIRGEGECTRCVGIIADVRKCVKQLKWLQNQERKAWVHILSQIDAGINGIRNKLEMTGSQLEHRVEAWRAQLEEGRQKQHDDAIREARELEQKAKYDSNPQTAGKPRLKPKKCAKKLKYLKL